MRAYKAIYKVERLLDRIQMINSSKKKHPPKGGYRPLLAQLRRLLTEAEASLEKAKLREQISKLKWITISCGWCLRPLMRVDPKGPLGQQKIKALCHRCDRILNGKEERRCLAED